MDNHKILNYTNEELMEIARTRYRSKGMYSAIYKETFSLLQANVYPQYKRSLVRRADDEVFIYDDSGINYGELVIWSACLIPLVYVLITNWENEIAIVRNAWMIVMLMFLYLILRCFRDVRKRFVFNRLTGEVTYPGILWFTTRTHSFNDTSFVSYKEGFRSSIPDGLAIRRARLSHCIFTYTNPYTIYSFLVWYMDKNRTLPKGSAFDAYREKDYLRRKAAGFPDPLYPSAIKIDEWDGVDDSESSARSLCNYHPDLHNPMYDLLEGIPHNFGRRW